MDWLYELFIRKETLLSLLFLSFFSTAMIGIKRSHLRRREKIKKEIEEVIQEEIDSALREK